ncbi:hypothetical protein [Roseobacter cerasinus]|uniref:hypothetical protein n=1 Tax=Roseobacter cerasinus TaxID=2602289 RepID=UPI001EEAF2EF|nr:hypothetical protein [Roseobacter cerasinus]
MTRIGLLKLASIVSLNNSFFSNRFALKALLIFTFSAMLQWSAASAQPRLPLVGNTEVLVATCTFKNGALPTGSQRAQIAGNITNVVQFYSRKGVDGNSPPHSGFTTRFGAPVRLPQEFDLGGTSIPDRSTRERRCIDAAIRSGFRPSQENHIWVLMMMHDSGIWGSRGVLYYGVAANRGLSTPFRIGVAGLRHEFGHTLSLRHAFGGQFMQWPQRDPFEYGDLYAVMGSNGSALNLHALDRIGALGQHDVASIGLRTDQAAPGNRTRSEVIRLRANGKGLSSRFGFRALRIPFDPNDSGRYYLVEYASKVFRGARRADRLYVYKIDKISGRVNNWGWKTVDPPSTRSVLMYVSRIEARNNRAPTFQRPLQGFSDGPISVSILSQSDNSIRLQVTSAVADACVRGLVWREATPADRVCVSRSRWSETKAQNIRHASGSPPSLGCTGDLFPRNAVPGDNVCVTQAERNQVRVENSIHHGNGSFRLAQRARGPMTCNIGLVWRNITNYDYVCVTPARRAAVRAEGQRHVRLKLGTSAGCRTGLVRRSALPGDDVCVSGRQASIAARETDTRESRWMFDFR